MATLKQVLGFGARWLLRGGNPPPPPPPPPRARMYIDGPRLMLSGQEFVPRGLVIGHGELYRPGDMAIAKARGANFIRTGKRWWGSYTAGFQVDSELDADPGHTNEDYVRDVIDAPLQECFEQDLRTNLYNDSNCGQGLGGEVCELGTGVNQDFFTPAGAPKRYMHIESASYQVERSLAAGRPIDMSEPLVEPQGNATQASLWSYQEDYMDEILSKDPYHLFVIGGYPNYQANIIGKAFNPEWFRPYHRFHGKIILTANYLSNIAVNTTLRASRLQLAVEARRQWNCPVYIQQMGTKYVDDPTNVHLDTMMTMLDEAEDGPMGYTFWEQLSVFGSGEGYGPMSLSNPNDPNSARVHNEPRWSVLTAHFTQ